MNASRQNDTETERWNEKDRLSLNSRHEWEREQLMTREEEQREGA